MGRGLGYFHKRVLQGRHQIYQYGDPHSIPCDVWPWLGLWGRPLDLHRGPLVASNSRHYASIGDVRATTLDNGYSCCFFINNNRIVRYDDPFGQDCRALVEFADPAFTPITYSFPAQRCSGLAIMSFTVPRVSPNGGANIIWSVFLTCLLLGI